MGPFEFMNVNDAKEMLNSRHVGGIKRRTVKRNQKKHRGAGCSLVLANACGVNPGSCVNKLRGGKRSGTKRSGTKRLSRYTKKRKSKRSIKNA